MFAGSQFTKPAERNYSLTEGKALALSYHSWNPAHAPPPLLKWGGGVGASEN